jgi:hypothetical protein
MPNQLITQNQAIEIKIDPIEIIKAHTKSEDPSQYKRFFETITHLYQFRLLKDVLDFTATKIQQGLLRFRVQEKKFFEMDEGNCRSMSAPSVMGSVLNAFRVQKDYVITIKKVASDVIMHEIGHMVEQELGDAFHPGVFDQKISQDILDAHSNTGNISLQEAIKSIMITEVSGYPDEQRISELFARYFQMLASARDVVRYGTSYSYSLEDMFKVFKVTAEYIARILQSFYKTKEYYQIKNTSEKYIKELSQIEHKWSEEKIHSFHKETTEGQKPVWKRNFQSIKDNPFKKTNLDDESS